MTTTPQTENARNGKISKTTGYYLAFFALGLMGAMLGPTLNALAEHTRSQISQISILFTARSLGYLAGSFVLGRLYDRLPGHWIISSMLVCMGILVAFSAVIPMLWLLFIVMLLIGVTEGIVDVGGNTLLMWVHSPNSGPFMNGLHFFFGAGAFISPLIIAWVVARTSDIQWAYWTLAILFLPAALWLACLPSPTNPAATRTGPVAKVNPILVSLVALFLFLYVGAEVSFGGWVYTYAVDLKLADIQTAALLTSFFWGALTAGRLLSIPIALRAQPRRILLVDLVGVIVSFLIVLFWPVPSVGLWVGSIAIGLFMASIFPTMLSFAEKRMAMSGKVTGYFFIGSSLGGMFVPWLCGQLFDLRGPQSAMILMLIVAVLNLALFGVLMKYSEKVNR